MMCPVAGHNKSDCDDSLMICPVIDYKSKSSGDSLMTCSAIMSVGRVYGWNKGTRKGRSE
jgi:hypothetical protein